MVAVTGASVVRRFWVAGIALAVGAAGFVLVQAYERLREERARGLAANAQVATMRNEITDHFRRTGALATDFATFVGEVRVSRRSERLGRIAFAVRAEGQRIVARYEADQGPFAGGAIVWAASASADKLEWRCWGEGIHDRYLPNECKGVRPG